MNLKEIRISKGFTQNQMAEKMAMEQTTYSKKERGISPINENEWKRLSEIFETPIDVLKKALPQMQRLSRHEQIDIIPIHKDVFFNILNKIKELSYENNDLKEAIQNLKKQA